LEVFGTQITAYTDGTPTEYNFDYPSAAFLYVGISQDNVSYRWFGSDPFWSPRDPLKFLKEYQTQQLAHDNSTEITHSMTEGCNRFFFIQVQTCKYIRICFPYTGHIYTCDDYTRHTWMSKVRIKDLHFHNGNVPGESVNNRSVSTKAFFDGEVSRAMNRSSADTAQDGVWYTRHLLGEYPMAPSKITVICKVSVDADCRIKLGVGFTDTFGAEDDNFNMIVKANSTITLFCVNITDIFGDIGPSWPFAYSAWFDIQGVGGPVNYTYSSNVVRSLK